MSKSVTFGKARVHWDGQSLTAVHNLHTLMDVGGNIIDTAEAYNAGQAEELIGRTIKKSGWSRDYWVICSKVIFKDRDASPTQRGLSRKHIIDAVLPLRVCTNDRPQGLELQVGHLRRVPVMTEEEPRLHSLAGRVAAVADVAGVALPAAMRQGALPTPRHLLNTPTGLRLTPRRLDEIGTRSREIGTHFGTEIGTPYLHRSSG